MDTENKTDVTDTYKDDIYFEPLDSLFFNGYEEIYDYYRGHDIAEEDWPECMHPCKCHGFNPPDPVDRANEWLADNYYEDAEIPENLAKELDEFWRAWKEKVEERLGQAWDPDHTKYVRIDWTELKKEIEDDRREELEKSSK